MIRGRLAVARHIACIAAATSLNVGAEAGSSGQALGPGFPVLDSLAVQGLNTCAKSFLPPLLPALL